MVEFLLLFFFYEFDQCVVRLKNCGGSSESWSKVNREIREITT